ncbi:oligosaccharide flippase family protein [Ornithinimicrobium pekingense]|uniref:Lipopolysaccharide biosynthesis protein n=1 Tax=Ornithinimicrobium pekingense TaxID=384677 RepID=A0ABQ2F9A4_9MICO|nr:oligosaccharide flippase family protein [Ornithinimicrobium pekingense]GGK71279.1 lipopolysaccharide biosynthesis protein [Ornithinimicrobium pekingense]
MTRRRRANSPEVEVTLARQAGGALGWSLLNTAASKVGTLVIGIALARILGPEEFGTFAVAMVALLAVLSFNELGVSLAIVRWKRDPASIIPTVATISVVTSLALFAACWAATPAYTAAMGSPQSTPVVRVLLIAILVNGVSAAPAALLQREFRQRERMISDQSNAWLGAGVSIMLALSGMGAMSLALGRLAGSVVGALLFLRYVPSAFRLGLDRSQVRPLLRFGLPLAGASIIVFASSYADQLIAGMVLGPTQLAFYVLAFNLASWPIAVLSQPLRSVAPAAFARMQSDPVLMARNLVWVVGLLAAVSFPVCFVLAGAAPAVTRVVYGVQWEPAGVPLAALGVLAAVRIVLELSYDYLVVLRRTGAILLIQLAWLAALVPTVLLGANRWGIGGVAVGQVVVAAAIVLPLYLWRLSAAGVAASRFVGRLVLPTGVGLALYAVSLVLVERLRSDLLAIALSAVVGLVAILAMLAREPAALSAVTGRFRRRPAQVGAS